MDAGKVLGLQYRRYRGALEEHERAQRTLFEEANLLLCVMKAEGIRAWPTSQTSVELLERLVEETRPD